MDFENPTQPRFHLQKNIKDSLREQKMTVLNVLHMKIAENELQVDFACWVAGRSAGCGGGPVSIIGSLAQ